MQDLKPVVVGAAMVVKISLPVAPGHKVIQGTRFSLRWIGVRKLYRVNAHYTFHSWDALGGVSTTMATEVESRRRVKNTADIFRCE